MLNGVKIFFRSLMILCLVFLSLKPSVTSRVGLRSSEKHHAALSQSVGVSAAASTVEKTTWRSSFHKTEDKHRLVVCAVVDHQQTLVAGQTRGSFVTDTSCCSVLPARHTAVLRI